MMPAKAVPLSARFAGDKRFVMVAFGIVTVILMVGGAFFLATSASKRDLALALALVLAPVLTYLAIKRPFVFPFGLYAAIVPFNNLIVVGAFGTVTKVLGVLTSLALLFYIIRSKRIAKPPRLLLAWFVLVAWSCTSILWALNPSDSTPLISTLLQLFFLFAAAALVPIDPSDLKIVLAMVVVGGTAAAAYGGKMFLAGAQVHSSRLFLEAANQGQQVDPNQFAAALILPIALALMATLRAPKIAYKAISLAVLSVLLVGIYASSSRGGLVAVAAIVVYVLWRTRSWLAMFLIGGVAGVLGIAIHTSIWARFTEDVSTGSGRGSIWTIGAHAFLHHPVIGAGIGNFPDAYDASLLRIYTPVFAEWDRAAHNQLLSIAVELGVVGVVLLIWVVVEQWRLLRHIGRDEELYSVRVALEAAFVGLMVASFFLDTLYWKYAWLTFTVMVLARTASIERSRERAGAPMPVQRRADMTPAPAVPRL